MNKIWIVMAVACLTSQAKTNNCISAVVGVPDYLNIKYTREINNIEITINTGINPTFSTFIPGIGIGYKVYQHNRYDILILFLTSYWPEMESFESGSTLKNEVSYNDWLHCAVRPDCNIDFNKIRFTFGFGFDAIFVMYRESNELTYNRFKPYYSTDFSIGYLF